MTPACALSQWHTPQSANHLVTRHRVVPVLCTLHTRTVPRTCSSCRRALTTGPAALIWYPVSPRESGSENGWRTAENRPCPHVGHSLQLSSPAQWQCGWCGTIFTPHHLVQVRTVFRSQEVSFPDPGQLINLPFHSWPAVCSVHTTCSDDITH